MATENAGVFEREMLPGNIDLLVWNTSKFKTVSFRICYLENLDHRAGCRALLAGLLRRGCADFPDMMSLSRHLEELFGAGLSIDVNRLGERQNLNVRFRVVNDRYVRQSKSALGQGLSLVDSILTEPITENGGFRTAEFEQERTNLIRAIRGLVDDKLNYAHQRLLSEMFAGEPYALFEWGTEEAALALDPRAALSDHFERLARAPIEMYVVGELDEEDLDLIRAAVCGLSKRREIVPVQPERQVPMPAPKAVREAMPITQSKLLIGYRLDQEDLSDRDFFALGVYNSILGSGSSFSKLFREVREERSLAYYAHSSLDRLKGFLLLSAGVAARQWEQAAEVMRDQVEAMRQGTFSEQDLEVARGMLLNSLSSVNDSPGHAADFVLSARAAGRSPDVSEVSRRIQAVTREDVVRVAKRPREQTTYLLEGTQDEQAAAG